MSVDFSRNEMSFTNIYMRHIRLNIHQTTRNMDQIFHVSLVGFNQTRFFSCFIMSPTQQKIRGCRGLYCKRKMPAFNFSQFSFIPKKKYVLFKLAMIITFPKNERLFPSSELYSSFYINPSLSDICGFIALYVRYAMKASL